MTERKNRTVRHLAYRDAEIVRTEVLRKKMDLTGGDSRRVKRHGWPLPERDKHPDDAGH